MTISASRYVQCMLTKKKSVHMRKVGDFCESIYLGPDIFGNKLKANIHFI